MALESLHIRDFRNITLQDWRLAPGLNVLEGENAQGKTNFLEAVYYLANGRSFRGSESENLIRFGREGAELRAAWSHEGLEHRLAMRLFPQSREVEFQKKTIVRLASVQASLRVLVFTPDSAMLFRSPPQARRRYFDHAIAVQRPGYATLLTRYQRVLRQRNQLLERGGPPDLEASFDRQWAESALALMREREAYLEALQGPWRERYQTLLGEPAELRWRWTGPLYEREALDFEGLRQALDSVKPEERRRGLTLLGPQRDDLAAVLEGHPLKEIASQGQQRMLVIALKLAEADLFQAQSSRAPVFLLDDLGSELDARHQSLLLGMLGELKAQTILTSAQQGAYAALHARTFSVQEGRLSE
ncbi:MAG: DNA replication and repair protein RecF [Deltaproteobacteria bacterium]|nr:DNA replication and repair protein RecF [Deltaproteobacteria bacterium]